MNDHSNAQTWAGTVAILVFGALLYLAGRMPDIQDRRRSALFVVSIYLFFLAVLRTVSVLGWMDVGPARVLNGVIAAVFAIALLDSLFLTPWIANRHRDDN